MKYIKIFITMFVAIFLFYLPVFASSVNDSIVLKLYNNNFSLPLMNPTSKIELESIGLIKEGNILKSKLNGFDFKNVVRILSDYDSIYKLNDYFIFQIIDQYADISLKNKHSKILFHYLILNSLKYDVDIYLDLTTKSYVLYVHSDTKCSGSRLTRNQKNYILLSRYSHKKKPELQFLHKGDYKGKKFDFSLNELPILPNITFTKKTYDFSLCLDPDQLPLKGDSKILVVINATINSIIDSLPHQLYPQEMAKIKFSLDCYNSLIISLRNALEGQPEDVKVRSILWFVQINLKYYEDKKLLSRDIAYSAEQTLAREYTDCEDRAILFFHLVKEIVNLPMVLLNYPNHCNIGVGLSNPKGSKVVYKNRVYTVCEPTVLFPVDFGVFDFRGRTYKIVYEYMP